MADDQIKPDAATAAALAQATAELTAFKERLSTMEKELSHTKEEGAKKLTAAHNLLVKEAVRAAARAEGLIDDALIDHLPIEGAHYRDDGVQGVEAALARLKEKFPKVFQKSTTTTTANDDAAKAAAAEKEKADKAAKEAQEAKDAKEREDLEKKAKAGDKDAKAMLEALGKAGVKPGKGEEKKPKNVMKLDKKEWRELVKSTREKLLHS